MAVDVGGKSVAVGWGVDVRVGGMGVGVAAATVADGVGGMGVVVRDGSVGVIGVAVAVGKVSPAWQATKSKKYASNNHLDMSLPLNTGLTGLIITNPTDSSNGKQFGKRRGRVAPRPSLHFLYTLPHILIPLLTPFLLQY